MRGRTNVGGSGNLEINGDIELFEVAEGSNIVAGDFVELTGENASINQLKSISNSACGVAKIANNMLVVFSYISKSTNISASVVEGNKIIKTYNFILGYHINSHLKYIKFNSYVSDGKIYLSYGVRANNDTGSISNEMYGTESEPLLRYVTEIQFDENGNLSKTMDYSVDFSGIANVPGVGDRTFYTNNNFVFNGEYAYSSVIFSNSNGFTGDNCILLNRFTVEGTQIKYESCLSLNKLIYNTINDYFNFFDGKLLFANVTGTDLSVTSTMNIQFVLYDISSGTSNGLTWKTENSRYYKNVKIIPSDNFIYTIYSEGSQGNKIIRCTLFQINNDFTISYVQESESSFEFDELFDCDYLENKNGNQYLLCYVDGNFTYKAITIKYEPIANKFSFFDYTLPDKGSALKMSSYYSYSVLKFAIPLTNEQKRTVIYLSNSENYNYRLIESDFIYKDEEIIFAEALNLIKNYENRISGVAQTSGSAGNKIQVKVPKQ